MAHFSHRKEQHNVHLIQANCSIISLLYVFIKYRHHIYSAVFSSLSSLITQPVGKRCCRIEIWQHVQSESTARTSLPTRSRRSTQSLTHPDQNTRTTYHHEPLNDFGKKVGEWKCKTGAMLLLYKVHTILIKLNMVETCIYFVLFFTGYGSHQWWKHFEMR